MKKAAVKKRLSRRVTRFAGDGCIKMSNNAAERVMRPIALGGKNWFVQIPAPEVGAAIISTLIETAIRNDVEGVSSCSLPARRPRTITPAGSLFRFARQVPRA